MTEARYEVSRGGALTGTISVPGDKSVSHRALIFSAISEGQSTIQGLLEGADVLATAAAMRQLGVAIAREPESGTLTIDGVGLDGLTPPSADVDCGNSGTAMRLLAGLLAAQPFATRLTGDASLTTRPMSRIIRPLTMMGAQVGSLDGRPPLEIMPAEQGLRGIEYDSPIASAQVKSCVLLAGLRAYGETRFTEPALSRDHTERMLSAAGVSLVRDGLHLTLQPGPLHAPPVWQVPGDFSSAFFWLVAASIVPDSELTLRSVGVNPTRTGGLDLLRRMGADIQVTDAREIAGEPIADLRVRSAGLSAIDIAGEEVVRAIDEFPALFVAAACAEGTTRLRNAEELRTKESDRIEVMARALQQMGAHIVTRPDGADITGSTLWGYADVDSHGDHRCAMALALACAAGAGGTVADVANVATSYPVFAEHAHHVGVSIKAAR